MPNNLQIGVDKTIFPSVTYIKFLGLTIDNSLNWKKLIEQLTTKLGKACYALRSFKQYLPTKTLLTLYYSLFHSVMVYGLIFWGNSTHSTHIFKIQKRAIRTIMGRQNRESCRELFKELKILSLKSQYILSLALFIVNNEDNFMINFDQHSIHTRSCSNYYLPQAILTTYQKGVYYSGVKICNNLPNDIKKFSYNSKKFKIALRQF
jgi:hypothetical protein